jgi:hypothetical protein
LVSACVEVGATFTAHHYNPQSQAYWQQRIGLYHYGE